MRLLLLLTPLVALAQSAAGQNASVPDLLTGSWINENRSTGGVTQVVVRRDGNRLFAHVWGSCTPIDCDWGEAEAELWNGITMIIWKAGFSTTRMQLVPQPDGRILVAYRSEYHDQSGRRDPGHAEFFARENAQAIGPDVAEAKALLVETAAAYRSLNAARFEYTETLSLMTGKSEVRNSSRRILLFAAPNRIRLETTGSREPAVRIADGESEWEFFPEAKEYTKLPQRKGPFPVVGAYGLLDKMRGTPHITGREVFQGHDCTIVRIALERGVTQELWIDNASHLVLRDSDKAPSDSRGVGSRTETVFAVARLEKEIDAAQFRFDPAASGAKSRTERRAEEAALSLVGSSAPNFALRDLDGREIRLSELRGKAVLLDFWGTWCGYCREALPAVELLHRASKNGELKVFGVDSEAPELARDYLAKYGYTLPSLIDSGDRAAALYHVTGWPTTVLIDRAGKVVFYEAGFDPEKLRDALRAIGVW